jgi:hypothetical protein
MINPFRLPLPGLIMRLAVAFSFIYPAVSALFDPYAWLGYFPGFVLTLAGTNELLLLHAWGALEILLALWVLFGKRVYVPALIMAAALVAVVIANPGQFPILFRDLSIALAAISLALVNKKKHGTPKDA